MLDSFTHLAAVARKFVTVESIATVLNAVNALRVFYVSQVPIVEVLLWAGKVITLDRALTRAKTTPVTNTALLATLSEDGPSAAVEGPATVSHTGTPVATVDTVLADIEALGMARYRALVE